MATVVPDSKSRYKIAGKEFDGQINPEEVSELVENLRRTFKSEKTYSKKWRIQQLTNLAKLLKECESELCEAMFKDLHKSHFEGYVTEIQTILGEIDNAILHLDDWMKPQPKGNTALTLPAWATVQRDPLGVVLVMGAWNYPIYLSLNPVVGAIAGGNCVILKPGSYAVHSSHILAKLVNRYLDPECVRVVEGNRAVTSALLEQKFEKIFFTGSGFVGKVVARAAAEHLTPTVLELGGKSPTVVDKSANIDHAVQRIVWGTFLNGGQTCVRPDFLLVHNDIADKFFARFKQVVQQFYSENPKQTEWFGRCINDAACSRLKDLVQKHKQLVVCGGEVDPTEKYISPTLFDFGTDLKRFRDAEVMQDEIFGPLLPAARFTDIENVIQFIRDLPTGKPLALYAFGTSSTFLEAIKSRTTSGGLCLNDVLLHLANHELPFGGVGNSGMGSYHGKYSFECFTHEKAVLEKSVVLDNAMKTVLAARFPPYNQKWKQVVIRSFDNIAIAIIFKYVHKYSHVFSLAIKILLVLLALKFFGYKVALVKDI